MSMRLRGDVIVWNGGWVLGTRELLSVYLSQKHPYTGKKLCKEEITALEKLIKRVTGETWKKYRQQPISKLQSVTKNKELGRGKYARVYPFGRGLALKIVEHRRYTHVSKPIGGKSEAQILEQLREKIIFPRICPGIVLLKQFTPGSKEDYLVMERLDTNLWTYLQGRVDPFVLRGILFQVFFALAILQKIFPGFRHNDIKTDNILLDTSRGRSPATFVFEDLIWKLPAKVPRVKLADFDFANIPGVLINPKVKSSYSKTFGCTPTRCDIYDVHLFLNSVYPHRDKMDTATKNWLLRELPKETRGTESKILSHARLRNPQKYLHSFSTPAALLRSVVFKQFITKKIQYPWWGITNEEP